MFFIAANSGPCAVTTIFRKPNAFVNVAPFFGVMNICRKEDMFIPKKYWSIKEKRLLNFSEILTNGVANLCKTEQYIKNGIELIENTPEEIRDLAIEMEQRLNGTWEENEDKDTWQQVYQDILRRHGFDSGKMPRIGTLYLSKNSYLLDQ